MAGESCNLDKDEAEILKPSSPSSASPSPAAAPSPLLPSTTPSLFSKLFEDKPIQISERPETPAEDEVAVTPSSTPKPDEQAQTPVRFSNMCSTCRKRVGITGFRCRCGDLFCGQHRYSDAHDCTFDYKAVGREEIAKANPVIRAAKIIKIYVPSDLKVGGRPTWKSLKCGLILFSDSINKGSPKALMMMASSQQFIVPSPLLSSTLIWRLACS